MKENKALFVRQLHNLIMQTSEFSDIIALQYINDKDGEWIYAFYESGSQKKIDITASSCRGIMEDFLNQINKNDWIPPEKRVYLPPIPSINQYLDNEFFAELNEKYTAEDFTGHIGFLLDDNVDLDDMDTAKIHNDAIDFLQEIYDIAADYVK